MEDLGCFPDPKSVLVRPRMALAGTSTQSSPRVHPSFNDLMVGPSLPAPRGFSGNNDGWD